MQHQLAEHLPGIAIKEGWRLIRSCRHAGRAADGSVRDGLSLLDQAIAMAEERLLATSSNYVGFS